MTDVSPLKIHSGRVTQFAATDTLPAGQVSIQTSGAVASADDVQDAVRLIWSTGIISGGAITVHGESGTVDIAPCDFVTRQGTSHDSPLVVYRDQGISGLQCTDFDVSYVYRDYNDGTPTWAVTNTLANINGIDKVIAYAVNRNGTTMKAISAVGMNVDAGRKGRSKDAEFDGFAWRGFWRSVNGPSSISSNALHILVGAGKYYWHDTAITHTAFDTTQAGTDEATTFNYAYNRNSWQFQTGQKSINNTQYDNAGTLTALSNNAYRTDWVFVVLSSISAPVLQIIMGNVQYGTYGEAVAAPVPELPPCMDGISVFVGQVIAREGESTVTVFHAGSVDFSGGAAASNHSALANLSWSSSGHTGTESNIAAFDSSGAATNMATVPYSMLPSALTGVFTDTKEPTGWVDNTAITVAYSYANRTITLTGTLAYYFNGTKHTLTSPWVSDPHPNTPGKWYLYSTDGTTFTWSTNVWSFHHAMVSIAVYGASADLSYGVVETHGLMPWQTHQELHSQIGTFRVSGGALTAGTYTENTQTDAANTPGFDQCVVQDEDVSTTIPAWSEGTYTTMYIGAGGESTFNVAATLPFTVNASYLQVNNVATGAMTDGIGNRYYNIYQLLVPATSDAGSQKYRMIMVQPQATFTSLATAQAEDPRGISLGTFASSEYILYARITYQTSNTFNNTGKCVIATGGVTYVTGNRFTQTSITSAGNHASLQNLSWVDSGHTGTASNLAGFTSGGAADDLTGAEVTALLSAFTGDSGSGGVKGVVPAPAVGDSTKYLKGDGTWATVSASGGVSAYTIESKTAAYTVVAADLGKILHCSGGSYTISLTAAATLGAGFYCDIVNTSDTSTHAITIDPNSTETIDGKTTWILRRGEGLQIYCTGTAWEVANKKPMRGYAENTATSSARPLATGEESVAIGSGATASGQTSTAVGSGATAGNQNALSVGASAVANGFYSTAVGVASSSAGSTSAAFGYSASSGGSSSTAVGYSSSSAGSTSNAFGYSASSAGSSSTAIGTNASSPTIGKVALANGFFAAATDSQLGIYILRRATTDAATATVLTTNNSAPSTTNLVTLPNNGGYAIRGLVIGRRQVATNEAVMFEFSGLARRGANAAATAIVGTITPTQTAADAALSTCTLTVTADTTNGGVALTVNGVAGANIRWVATVWATECVYA